MSQKIVSQSFSFRCSRNQSRNINDSKWSICMIYNSEIGDKCRKVIICNFCFCMRYRVDERRFSYTWCSNKSNISKHLDFKDNCTCTSKLTFERKLRVLIGCMLKMDISLSSSSSLNNLFFLSMRLN